MTEYGCWSTELFLSLNEETLHLEMVQGKCNEENTGSVQGECEDGRLDFH